MMDWPEIRAAIESLQADPLGRAIVETWPTRRGEVRWNSGYIQTRAAGNEYFSLPLEAGEFLEKVVVCCETHHRYADYLRKSFRGW